MEKNWSISLEHSNYTSDLELLINDAMAAVSQTAKGYYVNIVTPAELGNPDNYLTEALLIYFGNKVDSQFINQCGCGGVCFEGMEKQVRDLTILCDYKNRHVILNYYYEEELIDRDGISFNEIYVHHGTVYFIKNKKRIVTINSKKYRDIMIGEDFQNYYIMRRDKNQIDIYFP